MATLFVHLALFCAITNLSYAFHPKLLNVSRIQSGSGDWSPARASWYGNPHGAGSDGKTIQIRRTYIYIIIVHVTYIYFYIDTINTYYNNLIRGCMWISKCCWGSTLFFSNYSRCIFSLQFGQRLWHLLSGIYATNIYIP